MSIETFTAGSYAVEGECESDAMQGYVLDPDHNIVAFPISRSLLSEDGSLSTEIPADGDYKVEVYCDGVWRVTFTAAKS